MSAALAPLWAIEQELVALLDSVETCPPELEVELQGKIDAYIGAEIAKVDQIAHVLSALEYEAKCAGDEISRLQDRKKAAAKAQEKLEAYVCRVIQARGVKALKGKTNTLSVRPSDAVVITNAEAVEERWKTAKIEMPLSVWSETFASMSDVYEPEEIEAILVEVSISKAEIKKALKAGEEISGADLKFNDNLQRR